MDYTEKLKEKNWMIIDIEYIQTSKTHQCVRKLYMLSKNGSNELELDFYPCVRYKDLPLKYKNAFHYCKKYIHKLSYNPRFYSPLCYNVLTEVNDFIMRNKIELVLYKGGTIEHSLCNELCIQSLNIENVPQLQKANSHDPKFEVNYYYAQIVGYLYL